jgi:O-antigen ligase/Tfp pilus assembly protein PilF
MTKKRRKTNKSLPKVNFDLSLDRVLLFLISFFVFSMPLFIWPGITEYGYGKSIFSLVWISILLAWWGISALVKGEWKVRLPWLTFPVLALIVVSFFSLIHAVNGRVVLQSLALVVFFFLFYLLLANTVKEKRDVTLILFALLLSAFFASLYGLLQYLGVMRGAHGTPGLNEIISTMGNRNYLGGFLAYLLIPSVILIVRLRSRILRAVTIILLSFTFGMAMLVNQAGTRVALLAAFIALLIGWAIFRPIAPLRKNRAWLIALLIVLAFTFLVEAPSGPLNSVVGLSADSSSWIGRIWSQSSGKTRSWDWWVGWEMFKEHPIVGVGLGNYKLNFLPYKAAFLASPQGASYDFYIPRAAQAHNDYVQVVAELGLFGSLAFLALLLAIPFSFWIRLRKNTDEFDRFDLLLLAGGIVVFLVHALVSFPAHLPASSLVLVLILGLASSPAYGSGATKTVHLTGWPLKGAIAGLLVVCLGVSVIGIRDYRANLLLAQGTRQLQIGQTRLAEATLERSVKLDFCPRQTYYYLATAKIKQGRYEEGLDDLLLCRTRFVAEEVYLTLANVAINLGETEIAQENVDLLLSTHPNPSMEIQAEYLNAMIALRKGDYDRAGDLLEALIEAHPSFERAYIALGDLYRGLRMPVTARKNYEKALTLIEKALTINQRKLSSATRMQADEYAKLRGEIDMLRKEKEAVETALRSLSTTTSP